MSLDCAACHPELHELCRCNQTTGCHPHSIEKGFTYAEQHARVHPDRYLRGAAA